MIEKKSNFIYIRIVVFFFSLSLFFCISKQTVKITYVFGVAFIKKYKKNMIELQSRIIWSGPYVVLMNDEALYA